MVELHFYGIRISDCKKSKTEFHSYSQTAQLFILKGILLMLIVVSVLIALSSTGCLRNSLGTLKEYLVILYSFYLHE